MNRDELLKENAELKEKLEATKKELCEVRSLINNKMVWYDSDDGLDTFKLMDLNDIQIDILTGKEWKVEE